MTLSRATTSGVLALAVALVLCGCAATDRSAVVSATPPSVADIVVPEPGRTIDAVPGAELPPWATGWRIAVVHPPTEEATALLEGVRAVADRADVRVEVYDAVTTAESDVAHALSAAVESRPDLVIGVGAAVVDTFALDTAQLLDQQFLVIGAQLAEPTSNVTAVIWDGATSRGSAVAPDDELATEAATTAVATRAVTAGVESVLTGVTGVVLYLTDGEPHPVRG